MSRWKERRSVKTPKTTRITRRKRLLCVAGPTRRSSFGKFAKDLRGSRRHARDRVAARIVPPCKTWHNIPRLPYISRRKPGRTFSELIAWRPDRAHLQEHRTDAPGCSHNAKPFTIDAFCGDIFADAT